MFLMKKTSETMSNSVSITTLNSKRNLTKEINPAEVVANRTDVAQHYNETFLNDNELKELW